jgi:hypothetical protein
MDPSFPESVPWDTAPHATPVEAIRAVREAFRDYGGPVSVPGMFLAPDPGPAPPAVADLTGDPACVAILRAWSRRPWEPWHLPALCDRMEELGVPRAAEVRGWTRGPARLPTRFATDLWARPRPRRRLGRLLRRWRHTLVQTFGDFENTLYGDAPDTSPPPF